jgi:NAD(P)H-hydrate epimerase
MIAVLTVAEMRAADAAAVAKRGGEALVLAAGTAVALEAQRMIGSCYGKRIVVIVGPGLNGADGRVAANWLRDRGSKVDVIEVANQPSAIRSCDLLIDAAFGVGCTRPYSAPQVAKRTKVLAVDLPSGVASDTGAILGAPLSANVTIALGAFKYAHVTGPASELCGQLRIADLGIVEHASDGVVVDSDLDTLIQRSAQDHKWVHAVSVFAGSPTMPGAAELVARGALAGGASMIRLSTRGDAANLVNLPPEVVRSSDKSVDRRSRVVVAGPGLGGDAAAWLTKRLIDVNVPVVLDADALERSLLSSVAAPNRRWVLTPHEGEFAHLSDGADLTNRIAAVRDFANETGCVVLLKGPTTVIANAQGRFRIVRSGTSALATAGSGDILSGLIGATIARGHDELEAAAMAAHLHGRAGSRLAVYAPASALLSAIAEILGEINR